MMDGISALRVLASQRTGQVVVTHMTANDDWSRLNAPASELDLHLGGAMGKASSLGLGIALACPDVDVWVLDGDGSLLMNLGTLVTIATSAPKNLVHFVYQNDAYDTTGGQPVPNAGHIDYAAMAKGAGYPSAFFVDNVEDLQHRIEAILTAPRPTLVALKVVSLGDRPPAGTPKAVESVRRITGLLAQRPEPRL